MGQINSLAFSVFWKREIVRRLSVPPLLLLKLIFYKSKGGKSTSTIVKKIYISTMLFPYFSPSTMTFTFYISTTFLASFLHSTSSKMAKSTIYSNPTLPSGLSRGAFRGGLSPSTTSSYGKLGYPKWGIPFL